MLILSLIACCLFFFFKNEWRLSKTCPGSEADSSLMFLPWGRCFGPDGCSLWGQRSDATDTGGFNWVRAGWGRCQACQMATHRISPGWQRWVGNVHRWVGYHARMLVSTLWCSGLARRTVTRRVKRIKGQRVLEESPGHISGRLLILLEHEAGEIVLDVCGHCTDIWGHFECWKSFKMFIGIFYCFQ